VTSLNAAEVMGTLASLEDRKDVLCGTNPSCCTARAIRGLAEGAGEHPVKIDAWISKLEESCHIKEKDCLVLETQIKS